MVGLDEVCQPFYLEDIVYNFFKNLNNDINVNAIQTPLAEIIYQVGEFFRILSNECEFTLAWQNGLLNGY